MPEKVILDKALCAFKESAGFDFYSLLTDKSVREKYENK